MSKQLRIGRDTVIRTLAAPPKMFVFPRLLVRTANTMNSRRSLLALPVALLLTSCQHSNKQEAEATTSHFQIVATTTRVFKLDTTSGQTWFMNVDAGGAWIPLPAASTANASKPGLYNTFLVIAKKPNLSLFELPESKRPPLVNERIQAIPDVISVELMPPDDPLGIRPSLPKK